VYYSVLNNKKVLLPWRPDDRNHTWQTFHLLLDASLNQRETIKILAGQNIGTNYGAQCIPAQIYYTKKYKLDAARLFPNAYKAYTKGLAIPIYERLSKDEIIYIAQTINNL
jgi:dTDP-4-amino-4,6-dideoxygalactose transaminase